LIHGRSKAQLDAFRELLDRTAAELNQQAKLRKP